MGRRGGMEAIQNLTNTINTFVRFFESINCMFWQLNWLEQNVARAQGVEGLAKMGIVFAFIGFAMFYTFGCEDDGCRDTVVNFGIVFLMVLVAIYLVWRRWQISQQQSNSNNRQPTQEDDREKLIPRAVPVATVPAYIVDDNDVELAQKRRY